MTTVLASHKTKLAVVAVMTLTAVVAVLLLSRGVPTADTVSSPNKSVEQVEAVSVTVSEGEVQLVANPIVLTAKKTGAFAACIFGVGVPIGLAWGIATNPAAWAWVLGRGPWPASVGGTAARYMETIKRACKYAIL